MGIHPAKKDPSLHLRALGFQPNGIYVVQVVESGLVTLAMFLPPSELLCLVPKGPRVKCSTKARLAQVSLPLVYPSRPLPPKDAFPPSPQAAVPADEKESGEVPVLSEHICDPPAPPQGAGLPGPFSKSQACPVWVQGVAERGGGT